jgi:hypothetical protein
VAWSQQSRADSSTTQVPMYIEVVAVPNGIAYWNPVKQKLYVYSADFRTCTGIYQMAKLGQPMTRTGQ